MSHQDRTIHLTGEIRQRLEGGVRGGYAAETHVGDTLFGQFVHGGHGELTVRVGSTRFRTEAEVRPDDLVTESKPAGEGAGRRRARPHVVEDGLIEARSPATDLVGDIHGMALADEVLIPAHSSVRGRFPRLARQRCAMHHDDRNVAVAALRHHIPHVHLIDGDVSARAEVPQLTLRLLDLLAANEEAALRLQNQRCLRGLHILECLRPDIHGRGEHARKGNACENRRSAQLREWLTSHVSLSSYPASRFAAIRVSPCGDQCGELRSGLACP